MIIFVQLLVLIIESNINNFLNCCSLLRRQDLQGSLLKNLLFLFKLCKTLEKSFDVSKLFIHCYKLKKKDVKKSEFQDFSSLKINLIAFFLSTNCFFFQLSC